MAYYGHALTGVKGMDVSANQGNVNFATAYAAGARYVVIRNILHWLVDLQADTLYNTALDSKAYQYAHDAAAAGLLPCSYHFITPDVYPRKEGAIAEAERYARGLEYVFGDLYPGYPYGKAVPTLDVEWPYGQVGGTGPYVNTYAAQYGADAYLEWVETCAERLKQITGFNTVFIYTGAYYAAATNNFVHSYRGTILDKYPLWLSAKEPSLYTLGTIVVGGSTVPIEPAYPNSNFTTFGNFSNWVGWQYSLDGPDVRQGATYGTSSTDVDLDVLNTGYDLSVLLNDYWKPRNTSPGGSIMAAGGTNLKSLSISGDTYMTSPKTGKETLVYQNLVAYKNLAYTDLTNTASNVNGVANTVRLIDGLPGKKVNILKMFVYTPTSWAGGTQGFSIESDEATPKVWGTVAAANMTSGNKTNTDGFTGFTAGANYLLTFPDGVGVVLRDIATPTAGTAQIYLQYEYI